MKRIFALFLSSGGPVQLPGCCRQAPCSTPAPSIRCRPQSAYIVNTDTNIIVYDKDSQKQVPPAA